jgi:uncharacterized protein YceK
LGELLFDKSGVLYGTTQLGGSSNCNIFLGPGCGIVFKLTPSGSGYAETIVYTFTGAPDGANPYGGLIVGSKGNLLGTTAYGANTGCSFGCGAVFELAQKSGAFVERVLYRFTGGRNGAWPKGALIADGGALYGTTNAGGGTPCTNYYKLNGCGTVYKLAHSGDKYSESVLYRFKLKTGAWSYASLITDSSGVLYGTAKFGGSPNSNCSLLSYTNVYGCGTVFTLTGSGTKYAESTRYRFRGGLDGAYPNAGLIMVKHILYGTNTNGGGTCPAPSNGCGTVFETTP